MVDLFGNTSSAEALFVSAYFVGFVLPMSFVAALSFTVGHQWRSWSEHWRISLVRYLGRTVDNITWIEGLLWMAVVFSAVLLMGDEGWSVGIPVLLVSQILVVGWFIAWSERFPVNTRADMLTDYSLRQEYGHHLDEVTDGFQPKEYDGRSTKRYHR